jgi:hypothetical protein
VKAYLVETFAETLKNCGLLLANRAVFSDRTAANKFVRHEKRRLKEQPHRIELWLIRTQELNHERLGELLATEDIWIYLVQRVEKLE